MLRKNKWNKINIIINKLKIKNVINKKTKIKVNIKVNKKIATKKCKKLKYYL